MSDKVKELWETLETDKHHGKTFGAVHKIVEEIMGRPVWTHEFAFPEHLYDELRSGNKGQSFFEGLREIEDMGKKVITVTMDKDSDPKKIVQQISDELQDSGDKAQ